MTGNENEAKKQLLPLAAEPAHAADKLRFPMFNVSDLLGDAREAVLVHAGEHYRLRITAKDKLILTK